MAREPLAALWVLDYDSLDSSFVYSDGVQGCVTAVRYVKFCGRRKAAHA